MMIAVQGIQLGAFPLGFGSAPLFRARPPLPCTANEIVILPRPSAEYGIIRGDTKMPRAAANSRGIGRYLSGVTTMDILPRTSGIYQILCVPTGKVYIGSSANLRRRWREHQKYLTAGTWRKSNHYLMHAWRKYGAEAFEFTILEFVEPEHLLEREQYYLDTIRPFDPSIGFNSSPTAGSVRGIKLSDERRKSISNRQRAYMNTPEMKAAVSARKKGRSVTPESIEKFKAWRREHPVTDEQKAAHGEKMRGRKASEETRAKLSAIHRGKKRTPESIERSRQARIGSKRSDAAREKMSESAKARGPRLLYVWTILSPDGTEHTTDNMAAFCLEHNLHKSSMTLVAQGKQEHHKGWRCRRTS